jgi:hypothetical protein
MNAERLADRAMIAEQINESAAWNDSATLHSW